MINPTDAKFAAISIILLCPVWPHREQLTQTGQALHDRIVDDAKPYAGLISECRFSEALQIAINWSPFINDFIDNNIIQNNEENNRMVSVYVYYMNCVCDWGKIEK
jgi:hypothetical protein